MAFDYGSIDLGLKNPFKTEGKITAARGIVVICLGVYALFAAASSVSHSTFSGWVMILFALGLLASGIMTTYRGISATLKYFVGRNHPTSLAHNHSNTSEHAYQEDTYVAYSEGTITDMLVGRKNATFVEPKGFLAHTLHSIFPSLIYMPYPIRNLAQRLCAAWANTAVALLCYGLVAFISLTGFIGTLGKQIFPVYSVVLTLGLMVMWILTELRLSRMADTRVPRLSNSEFIRTLIAAAVLPVGIGLVLKLSMVVAGTTRVTNFISYFSKLHNSVFIAAIIVGAALVTLIVALMLNKRLSLSNPKVEVSELRENWQESVHPNEIFINLDNLVMANRRYKEVPNRVYKELKPTLNEQVQAKGSFAGETLQEVQPKYKEVEVDQALNSTRIFSLISGNLLLIGAAVAILFSALSIAGVVTGGHTVTKVTQLFFIACILKALGSILVNASHLFFAEMMFESNVMYLKVEGTFTESKISTGNSIHDSTRSENILVRSSITPWIIVSRIVSSSFASSGSNNLEHPRFILEMHKNDHELDSIRNDLIMFLKDRESIASITSQRDLMNTSQIHEINKQTRAQNTAIPHREEEMGGYIRRQEEEEYPQ
ncbi:hypothetical protein [Photobacterium leiognathi]|uniref:hypothetical protein n=1 Tax=Photobacterium leiognathi TaxID=553611 RepID=UPI002736AEC2|nr:hypothetical protein [Photobacterium leiognathi]